MFRGTSTVGGKAILKTKGEGRFEKRGQRKGSGGGASQSRDPRGATREWETGIDRKKMATIRGFLHIEREKNRSDHNARPNTRSKNFTI